MRTAQFILSHLFKAAAPVFFVQTSNTGTAGLLEQGDQNLPAGSGIRLCPVRIPQLNIQGRSNSIQIIRFQAGQCSSGQQ